MNFLSLKYALHNLHYPILLEKYHTKFFDCTKYFYGNKFSTSIILCIDFQLRKLIMSTYLKTTVILNPQQLIINHGDESIVNDFGIILFISIISQ